MKILVLNFVTGYYASCSDTFKNSLKKKNRFLSIFNFKDPSVLIAFERENENLIFCPKNYEKKIEFYVTPMNQSGFEPIVKRHYNEFLCAFHNNIRVKFSNHQLFLGLPIFYDFYECKTIYDLFRDFSDYPSTITWKFQCFF